MTVKSKELIKSTKQKFYLYSIIAGLLVFSVSVHSLNVYKEIIDEQKNLQNIYVSIGKQIRLINQASLISEQIETSRNDKSSLKSALKSLLINIKAEVSNVHKYLHIGIGDDNRKVEQIDNLYDVKAIQDKTQSYLNSGFKLTNFENLSKSDTSMYVRQMTDNSSGSLTDLLIFIGQKAKEAQTKSMEDLNRVGFVFITLCFLQIIIVWLFIFKPLYRTISEQNEKITDALLRAENASRSKSNFLANISHEIRTPMTAILGYADILKTDEVEKQERDEIVQIIDKNANHLIGIIDEVLDISKIEAGKLSFEFRDLKLAKFLEDIENLLQVKAVEKNIELSFVVSETTPSQIYIDPKRLKQILINLIGNSLKFTEVGKVVVHVSYCREGQTISFLVEDTGVGITKEQLPKLFKPFEQGENSVSRKFGGTGLGLALSKKLAREMSGDVKILETKSGVGTKIEASFQVGEVLGEDFVDFIKEEPQAAEQVIENSKQLAGYKILVVEDAKENARLFKMYLEFVGADVEVCYCGETAVQSIKKHNFDVVLLDLQLPGKDGFQVLSESRNNGFTKPIIALTAHAMKEEVQKTQEAGFNMHITKPVKSNVLIDSVTKILKPKVSIA